MIRKQIVLPSPREEVWEALTDQERLEDWFANEVELDLREGGDATFRWGNGEERRAVSPRSTPVTSSPSSGRRTERSGSRSTTTPTAPA